MSGRSGKQAYGINFHEKSTENCNLVKNGYVHNNYAESFPAVKGYLPFSHNSLTAEMVEYARKHLNETDETRKRALEEMRDILRSDPDLVFPDEDIILLCYLRGRKFNVKRAVDIFKVGVSYVDTYRQALLQKDSNVLRKVVESNLVGFLPYRTSEGRSILYIRAAKWDPNEIAALDLILAGTIVIQSVGHNPVSQVNGFSILFDATGLTFQHLFKMRKYLIYGSLMFQRGVPVFMKAFHVINFPTFLLLGWKIVKPLLSEKIQKRFIFHKSDNLSSLHEHLPKEILPAQLGGPYEFSNDHWSWDLDNIEKELYDRIDRSYFKSKRKNNSS